MARKASHTRQWIAACVAVLACMLVTVLATPAVAQEIDLNRTGSISITLRDSTNGRVVSGGEASVYQVATIERDGNGYKYVYVDGFGTAGEEFPNSEITNPTTRFINRLVRQAEQKGATQTQTIGRDGKVTFTDLKVGVYLVRHTRVSDNGETFNAFLVTIPSDEHGGYDVDATPKVGPITPYNPNNPVNPSNNNNNTPSNNGNDNHNNGNENHNNGNTPSNNGNNTPGNGGNSTDNGGGNGSNGGGGSNGGSETPSGSSNTKTSESGNSGSSERLPQTGQLWWPVWALLAVGGTLVIVGFSWRSRRQKHNDGKQA